MLHTYILAYACSTPMKKDTYHSLFHFFHSLSNLYAVFFVGGVYYGDDGVSRKFDRSFVPGTNPNVDTTDGW